ncbi:very short patch repair endonuclease [Maritalea mobilis]|uniref:very short patch repair endonuclease n=1 Tax=Maritalea mobilis TaxID=483324 RepID=UPI001C95B72E|nr:very short patch repair endonuclease [Maritalea mobilis]MBY6203251.1 very short patch repair endonuclease [Maritalea mobilis]
MPLRRRLRSPSQRQCLPGLPTWSHFDPEGKVLAETRTPLTRSEMMSRIRSKDTKPEMLLRKGLHAAGYRFRLHVSGLPGKPDIVLPRFRSVIFVHGCFWHGHSGCKNYRIPKTRTEFWTTKIAANRDRDSRAMASLLDSGWRVLVVWECATRTISLDRLIQTVVAWLQGTARYLELGAGGTCSTIRSSTISRESRYSEHDQSDQ